MDLPSVTGALLPLALVGTGLVVLAVALRAIALRHRDRRFGALVAIDAGAGATLTSSRYRLSGRPDILRRSSSGRLLPVELKSRATPPRGPARSHVVQVWAYCLLIEETEGAPPPYGVLRYSDGAEFEVRWDREARAALLALRAELDRPYDGRATPSPAKCAHCAWRAGCDARAGA